MHPIVCQRLMPAAACLSRFVFMMRKHEVSPTAVDINWRPKVAVNHGAALRMPARTSFSPWTRPAGLTRLCGLPKGKIKRVALLGIDLNALARTQLIQIATRQHAIIVIRSHREVHVSRRHCVGKSLINEGFDHLNHGIDFMRGARANVGIKNVKAVHLLNEGSRVFLRNLLRRTPLLKSTIDNLIVNVRQILCKGNLVSCMHEVPAYYIKRQERACITDMYLVIHRRTTNIHSNFTLINGCKSLFAMRLSIVNEHVHSLL